MNEWRESDRSVSAPLFVFILSVHPLGPLGAAWLITRRRGFSEQTRCCLSGLSAPPGHGPGQRTTPCLCLSSPPPSTVPAGSPLCGAAAWAGWAGLGQIRFRLASVQQQMAPEPQRDQHPPSGTGSALEKLSDTFLIHIEFVLQGNVSSAMPCMPHAFLTVLKWFSIFY